jgi:uncharacterized protein (DUF983 family)
MLRLVTQEDVIKMDCPSIDINPYCQVLSRGMNISCHECRNRNLWEKFLKQDMKKGVA